MFDPTLCVYLKKLKMPHDMVPHFKLIHYPGARSLATTGGFGHRRRKFEERRGLLLAVFREMLVMRKWPN